MKADQSSVMVSLNVLQAMVSLNIYKNSANKFGRKTDFKIDNLAMKFTVYRPQNKGDQSKLVCIFCPNLVVLADMGGELCRGQVENGINLDFQIKLTLKVRVNHPTQQ